MLPIRMWGAIEATLDVRVAAASGVWITCVIVLILVTAPMGAWLMLMRVIAEPLAGRRFRAVRRGLHVARRCAGDEEFCAATGADHHPHTVTGDAHARL